MKKIFLDANIFIDYLKDRGFGATGVEKYVGKVGYPDFYISVLTVHIAFYVLKVKYESEMYRRIKNFLKYVNVIPLTQKEIDIAMSIPFCDFEDTLQYLCAIENCEYILTRDKRDFDKLKNIKPSGVKIVRNMNEILKNN